MSTCLKPPCCNGTAADYQAIYNGDSFTKQSPAPKWEMTGFDAENMCIPDVEKFVICRYWTLSNKSEGWAYEDITHYILTLVPGLNAEQIKKVVTSFAVIVTKNINFNGDLAETLKQLAGEDNDWTVEKIYEAFCNVIEDWETETPWADASHNDKMREARIIHDRLLKGEIDDVYNELYELMGMYGED